MDRSPYIIIIVITNIGIGSDLSSKQKQKEIRELDDILIVLEDIYIIVINKYYIYNIIYVTEIHTLIIAIF